MQSREQIIKSLKEADGARRNIDVAIARLVGFARIVDPSNGNVNWTHPKVAESGLPRFTASIDAAKILVELVNPNRSAGFMWDEKGVGAAIVEGGLKCDGHTPAIALCIAALASVYETVT